MTEYIASFVLSTVDGAHSRVEYVRADPDMPSAEMFATRFHSREAAEQALDNLFSQVDFANILRVSLGYVPIELSAPLVQEAPDSDWD